MPFLNPDSSHITPITFIVGFKWAPSVWKADYITVRLSDISSLVCHMFPDHDSNKFWSHAMTAVIIQCFIQVRLVSSYLAKGIKSIFWSWALAAYLPVFFTPGSIANDAHKANSSPSCSDCNTCSCPILALAALAWTWMANVLPHLPEQT